MGCLPPGLLYVLVYPGDDVLAGRKPLLLQESDHCRRDEVVEAHDRIGVVPIMLAGKVRDFLVAQGQCGSVAA